jgi:hypothetical protein
MNKQTKMLVGVGVVAVAGYFIYQSTQKKSFANLTAPTGLGGGEASGTCPCSYPVSVKHNYDENGNDHPSVRCSAVPPRRISLLTKFWDCGGGSNATSRRGK